MNNAASSPTNRANFGDKPVTTARGGGTSRIGNKGAQQHAAPKRPRSSRRGDGTSRAMRTRARAGGSTLGPVTMVPVGDAGGQLAAVKVSSPAAEARGGLPLVMGHGLTRNKEHQAKYCKAIQDDRVVILYDARGHGESSGWEAQPPEAFTWEAQRGDVFAVADAFGLTGAIVVGGNSMTSAASVYAALGEHAAERVAGLVFCRLPTAWEAREARREGLLAAATSGEGRTPGNVLTGAAMSDLPSPAAMEGRLPGVPALLVSTHDDPVHPVSTPRTMAGLLPGAELVICERGKESIQDEFPGIIRDFLRKLDGGEKPCDRGAP